MVILKAASWNLVESQYLLVRVLDQDILSFWSLETHVSDCADNTPPVGEREVHLGCKVTGLPADNAEDNVAVIGLGVRTRDESNLQH